MIAIDTETTGVDLRHGAKPFIVTYCREGQEPEFFEWDVDPYTREPLIPLDDLVELEKLLTTDDDFVLQNPKFDVAAFSTILPSLDWPWDRTYDTLLAGHLLASNQPHDLTSMALVYLGVDIKGYEDDVERACNEARRLARSTYPTWRIAKKDLPEMPSAKDKTWKYDMWLPRAIARERGYKSDHPWWTVASDYANADSQVTVALYKRMKELIQERGLWAIYEERLKLLPIATRMEATGITVSGHRLRKLETEYAAESSKAGNACEVIAVFAGYNGFSLPKSGSNKALLDFVFNPKYLDLPPLKASKKTGNPSFDKACLEAYLTQLDPKSEAHAFLFNLQTKRKRDTALQYMQGYRRYWLPADDSKRFYRLHPSLNPTGTDTLRWSSSNPNEQNISKQEGFNLRYCFGPMPGREWWSMDAKNIELRIPAYESGEEAFIALFERPNDPPYFGSNHLLISHLLHKKAFEECRGENGEIDGRIFKKKYAATLYQWVKNGNFAVQYGAVDRADGTGTADRTYKIKGAQALIAKRFTKQDGLNKKWIEFAEKHGYVETMPDKTVDPERGYPLLCSRTTWGGIKPTVPLNYHVQGTAMWWMMKAMIRCFHQLEEWNRASGPNTYFIALQVHDELVFDFPKGEGEKPWLTNLPKIRRLQKLMEKGGEDIGVPTPVSAEYHAVSWDEGKSIF